MYTWHTGHFIHCIIHTLLFLGFIDFALVFVIFQKQYPNHTKSHQDDMLALSALNFANHFFYFIFSSTFFHQNKEHVDILIFFFEIVLLSSNLIQLFLGYFVRKDILQTSKYKQIFFKKKIHQILAIIFIVSAKIKIVLVFVLYIEYLELYLSSLVALYFLINIIIYLIVWFIKYKNTYANIIHYASLSKDKNTMIQSIQRGFYIENDSYIETKSLESFDDSLNQNQSTIFSQFKWIIFENKIYELKNFDHPGGNFILKVIKRKDITKIVHGKQSLVIFDEQEKIYKIINKLHSFKIYNYLDKNCLGEIQVPDIFHEQISASKNKLISRKSTIEDILLSKIFKDNMQKIVSQTLRSVRYKNQFLFQKSLSFKICQKYYVVFVSKKQIDMSKFKILFDSKETDISGRNIMIRFKDKNFFFGYSVQFLSPNYLKYKERLYKQYSLEFFQLYKDFQRPFIQNILKEKDCQTNQDILTNYLPIYVKIQKHYLKQDFDLEILGQKNVIRQNSIYKHLIIAKNEGIIPFLDLLDELATCIIKKNDDDQINQSNSTNFQFYNLLNFGQLKVYWFISERYWETAQNFGLLQIKILQELCFREKYNFLAQIIVQGNQNDQCNYFQDQFYSNKDKILNIQQILNKMGEVDKILISAGDNFISKLFQNTKTNYFKKYKINFI